VACDHDARQIRGDFVDLADELEPVDAGHLDVGENEVQRLLGDDGKGLRGVSCDRHRVAHSLEDALQGVAIKLFVVDDEDVRIAQRRFSGWRREPPGV
jgi:hypothetical protein